jgi:hypothetical protein
LVQKSIYHQRCVLLSRRCGCECERWVDAAKRAVTQKLFNRLRWFVFFQKPMLRQREFCFDQSKWTNIAKDVLCWVEVVGVNVKDVLKLQNKSVVIGDVLF